MPVVSNIDEDCRQKYDLLLFYENNTLALRSLKEKSKPFYIDFASPKLTYRRTHTSLRKELLARALGVTAKEGAFIVDATAGTGTDSFILATLGFEITLLERSKILFALLENAKQRAMLNADLHPVLSRMHLFNDDALSFLPSLKKRPDIIYIDPMFPPRLKKSAVKKSMQMLQALIGSAEDKDVNALFELALTCATHRVVVKRPRLAYPIAHYKPHFVLTGTSSRFDIYLTTYEKC